MKYLIALACLQSLLLIALLWRSFDVPAQTLPVQAVTTSDTSPVSVNRQPSPAGTDLRAEQVRAIIREELSAWREPVSPGIADMPLPEPMVSPAAVAAVESEIDYFVSVGEIDHAEMARLQMRIAGLPPEERQLMLNRLVSALNSGSLRGEL